jgi:hypothetical protein
MAAAWLCCRVGPQEQQGTSLCVIHRFNVEGLQNGGHVFHTRHAGDTGAFVERHAGAHCVGAVQANEPPVLTSDHETEVEARDAIRAPNGQDCVSQQWALLSRAALSKRGSQSG